MTFTARVERTVAVHAHGVERGAPARGARMPASCWPQARACGSFPSSPNPVSAARARRPSRSSSGQDVWDGLVRDEIERARAAGADTLAGIYHGCQRMICGFEAEGRITIEHYLSVFARALGIEFEDQFKKYRLWGDPDRVLEDMAPCQQANGVDPEKARALVMATFAHRSAPGGAATAS